MLLEKVFAMEGVLNVDKPGGMSSHDVVNRIRRLTGTRRVGHAGTLDPLATGILLLCVGRTTRLVEYLVGQPKTYEAVVRLGQETNTYDAEGEIVAERPFHLTQPDIEVALSQFRGDIQQKPPMFSAVKQKGQPLYKLARQGKEVERPHRDVTIYELEILAWDAPDLTLSARCSSGTYVRSLAHDLGQALGCGGHIAALRRTEVGDFTLDTAVPLDQLTPENIREYVLPAETAVAHLPRLDLNDTDAARLLQGLVVARQSGQPEASLVRAYDPQGAFIGVVTNQAGVWKARKMFPALDD